MRIAITGATGFLGRYIVRELSRMATCRCWRRPQSDVSGFAAVAPIEWTPGDLGDSHSVESLVRGVDAVVHAALYHPGGGYRGGEGDLHTFLEKNFLGSIDLIQAARAAGVPRFVFISTCAVHEVILSDRALDEAHPLWPTSHYGAHKAAIEAFVHSFGLGQGYDICALRPTGIYGAAHPVSRSKWFSLIQKVGRGDAVHCERGGKEVHAADVARAVRILLDAPAEKIRGQSFNCYDMYIAELAVARLAQEVSGSKATITGSAPTPKNQIDTTKLRALGMEFGGAALLHRTVRELLSA